MTPTPYRRRAGVSLVAALLASALLPAISVGEERSTLETRTTTPLVDRSAPPAPGAPRPFVLPAIRSLVLDNGLEVTLVERPGFPTFSARLAVEAGTGTHADNLAVPVLVARLLRDGTRSFTSEELAGFIDANGIAYGASAGPSTVTLSADAINTGFDEVLTLLAEVATSPTFPSERVAARKAEYVGEQELARGKPEFHLDRRVQAVLFGDHPWGRFAPELDQIRAVEDAQIRAHYERTFAPQRARLVIVGDLPDDAESLISAAFGAWSAPGATTETVTRAAVNTCNDAHVVVRPNSVQTAIAWVGPGVSVAAPDYVEALAANQVIGGGSSSRLFGVLREQKSYTYGAYSRFSGWDDVATLRAFSNVRGEVTSEALADFEVELARFAAEPVPESELKDARDYLAGVFPIDLQTNSQMAGQILSLLNAGQGLDYLERFRGEVLSVTPEAASIQAARLHDPEHLSLVMVGEEDRVVTTAVNHSSHVYVYDLDGALVRELDGVEPDTCNR